VFSDRLSPEQRKNHNIYLTQANTTGTLRAVTGDEKLGFKWKITYGDGTGASGIVYSDKVKVGGVTATAQAVEAATSVAHSFLVQKNDGLLGLGFGRTNTVTPEKQQTFFENVKSQLKEPLFTVSLKKNATGVYDFGYIDDKKYQVCCQGPQ
jgi:aspergillopepsin I